MPSSYAVRAELAETRNALEALSAVSRAIAEARLEVDAVMETIASSVAESLGDACALWVLVPDGQGLVMRAGDHRIPAGRERIRAMIGERIGLGVGVSGMAMRERRAVALADLDPAQVAGSYPSARGRDYFRDFPPLHAAAAPLLARGELLGALSVSRLDGGEPFSPIELWLLDELATRAALALANARQAAELRRSREELAVISDALPALISYVDTEGRYRWANAGYRRWFGLDPEQLVDRTIEQVVGPEAWAQMRPHVEAALRGEPVSYDTLLAYRHGPPRFVRAHYLPRRTPTGEVEGLFAMVLDITEEQRAAARVALLAGASEVLASSLDWEKTLHNVIALALPELGELGFFDVVEDDGQTRRIALVRAEPGRQAILDQIRSIPERADSSLRLLTADDTPLLAEHGLVSMLSVPLRYQDRILGALTLFHTTESGRRHDPGALRYAEELAHRAAAAVENARLFREARRAIAVREEFLAVAGHELRTPLTSLRLLLETLVRGIHKGDPLEKLGPRADKTLRHLERFGALIDDLLDISKITAGRLTLERTRFRLAQAVADVLARSSDELARSGCQIGTRLDATVVGSWDRLRIEQITTNLLSNAIKYGRGKPIEVTVDAVGASGRLVVRDHGIGIAAEDHGRVFQRFERAVSSSHFGGLGLGLWIVHELVEAHGGTIRLESAEGEGARFEVLLPMEEKLE